MDGLWKSLSLLCLVSFTRSIVEATSINGTVTVTVSSSTAAVAANLTAPEVHSHTVTSSATAASEVHNQTVTSSAIAVSTSIRPSPVQTPLKTTFVDASPTSTASVVTTLLPSQQTSTASPPATMWFDKFWAEIDPLPGVIALICAACVIIILIIALCCVCHKYRKLKKLYKYKSPNVNDNTDWVRGHENVLMYERSLRASEVTPHYPMDYAGVNGDRPPSYSMAHFPVHERHVR